MATERVFVVTGSNKGIGKSIVKLLLQDAEQKIVYLTSRSIDLGTKAVDDLKEVGLQPEYHQLDITDKESVETLKRHLVEKHGGLDVLVNNAGMAYKGASTAPFSEQARVTNNCNFFGTADVCEILFPILRSNGRVVHVSSGSSVSAYKRLSDSWKLKFSNANLNMDELKGYISEFVTAAEEGKVEDRGWPCHAYGISKVGMTFLAILQQKEITAKGTGVIVNACCPGLVATDMTGGKYSNMQTPDEGADTPTYLALLDGNTEVRGCFVKKREVVPYPPN